METKFAVGGEVISNHFEEKFNELNILSIAVRSCRSRRSVKKVFLEIHRKTLVPEFLF